MSKKKLKHLDRKTRARLAQLDLVGLLFLKIITRTD